MIQRKQTIYLLLAFTCITILLFVPIFSISASQFGETISGSFGAHGMSGEGYEQEFPLYLLFIGLALLSALGIMLYKNRKRQLMICRINLILHILVVFALATFFYVGRGLTAERLESNGFVDVKFVMEAGFYLAVSAIPFLILAIRGIKADEKLLQSIDRIR